MLQKRPARNLLAGRFLFGKVEFNNSVICAGRSFSETQLAADRFGFGNGDRCAI
jgi:hypothetical protein